MAHYDVLVVAEELARSHRGGGAAEQGQHVEVPEGRHRECRAHGRLRRDVQRPRTEERVRRGLGDDGEVDAFDHLARAEREVEARLRPVAVAEPRLEGGEDVQRVRGVSLQLAVALDAADDGGVEAEAEVEQEPAAVDQPDTDAFERFACE